MSEYIKIFISFFKIGLFTIGGGYAMMPMFRHELINKHHYITENELLDYYSLGQCTPGIIAINVATFTGYKIKQIKGAFVATLAIVLPSLVIILAIANILDNITQNEIINHAFQGIRIGVIALIANEALTLFQKSIKNNFQRIFFVALLILLFCIKLSAISAIILAALTGFLKKYYNTKRKQS